MLLFAACERSDGRWFWNFDTEWWQIFQMLHREFLRRPMDEFTPTVGEVVQVYRELFLGNLAFNRIFDILQLIMRHPSCPVGFTVEVAEIFKQCQLAYVVNTEQPVTILPAATKQEGEAIIGAIKEFREAGLHGAEAHLKKAGELINERDWPGAVRESIHAVESVARQLDPDASNKLDPALASLERKGRLHPAMKQAFSRLYGYTSNEEGIRHALLTTATSPVGQDEAVFMLGACASFASYLWRRHQSGS